MSDRLTSPFHKELFNFLLSDVEKKIQEQGLTQEKEFINYKEQLTIAASAHSGHSFIEILENYQRLFSEKMSFVSEKKLLEAITAKGNSLKISRGLPRLYNKNNPSQSHVKKEFCHIPSLKHLSMERFSLPLYENFEIANDTKIVLFTYMMSDGWGDLVAHKEAVNILRKRFPLLSVQSIVCMPRGFSLLHCHLDVNAIIVPYRKECPLDMFPKEALKVLRAADLIVSIPTYYPYTKELKNELLPKKDTQKNPRFICIGQYGFLESDWFHPRSGNYSMGLHFLEKGIFTREYEGKADFRTLENKMLLHTLFGTAKPQTIEVEKYLSAHKLYLSYLISPIGGAIYLHALLQSEMKYSHDIDICSPDIGWFIEYIKKQALENRPILEKDFGIRSIEIHYEGKIHSKGISAQGKKVRILCPGHLSDADFRTLVRLSEEFIAIRGDQSFSEAVSANRLFFYDGAPHARYFLKDLLALAENRVSQYQATLTLFRAMGKAFLYNIEQEPDEWVEETYFQEKHPWIEIAENIADCLQKPNVLTGFKRFNQIISNEYSFNKTFCQIVQKELSQRVL